MRWIVFVCLTISISTNAQLKSFMIGVKGDTLNRVDANGLKQGRWVSHIDALRGEPGYEEEGVYKDGKKEGTWRTYNLQGDLTCLLYTSDAADERSSVDLGGRRIIKK